MDATGDHVVIGAAGGTGSAVVSELAARGRRVRAVTRSGRGDVPEGVEQVAADVGTAEGARRACEGAAVVYHCAQPPYTKWAELFPPMTEAVLDGAAAAGAKLVFADNLYVYGPPDGPMTEETPQRAQGKKGRIRIEMADAVLGAHADGRLRVAIGRSSDYYGPRGHHLDRRREHHEAGCARQAGALARLARPASYAQLSGGHGPRPRDAGRARRGRRPGLAPAGGGAPHGPTVPRAGVRGGRAPPKDRRRVATDDQGRGRCSTRSYESSTRRSTSSKDPSCPDASKFQAAFGPFEPTPHRAAVSRTVDWFRRRYGV